MLQSKAYKIIEFIFIFIIIPFSFLLDYSILIKIGIAVFGFIYIIWILLRVEKLRLAISKHINWKSFWKMMLKRFIAVLIFSVGYMSIVAKNDLFDVVINKPLMWLIFVAIYSVTSVYPQELIYRTFFDARYKIFFTRYWLFILANGLVFSFAHIIFWNPLVLCFTFIGGLFFAMTYAKTKSTLLVSIEHAIYGSWLFTVGMGSMLGFPV